MSRYYYYSLTLQTEKERRKLQHRTIRDASNPFELPEEEFRHVYRVCKEMALHLCAELDVGLQPHNNDGLPVYIKVLTSLHFLANGNYQRGTGQDHGLCIAQCTVSNYLAQFTDAVIRRTLDMELAATNSNEILTTQQLPANGLLLRVAQEKRATIGIFIICIICACVTWCCRFFCPINEGAIVLSRPGPNDIYPVNVNHMYPPNPTTYPGATLATDNGNSATTYSNINMHPTMSGVNQCTIYPENPNAVYHPSLATNPAESAPVYRAYPIPYPHVPNVTHFELNPNPSYPENPNPICPPIPPYPKANLNPGYGFHPSICPNLSPNSLIENPNPARQCVNPTAPTASVDM